MLKNERTRAGFIVGSLPFIGEGDNRYNSYNVFFTVFFFFLFLTNVGFKTNNLLFFVRAEFARPSFCNLFRSFVRS